MSISAGIWCSIISVIICSYHFGIGCSVALEFPLRLKTARDCYASCLNRAGVPTKFISELMVHSSVHVTENYLSGMNNKEIFDANSFLY